MDCCIRKAKQGDQQARTALVEQLYPRIWRMAAYYGRRCGEDADDLMQEAWISILEALPELDLQIGSPTQHLIARARWRILDTIKRQRVRRCAPLDEERECAKLSASPVDKAIASAHTDDFKEQLKEPQQEVLRCLMNGMTWRETGEALGFSSANVAYHVRQIRKRYDDWSGDSCDDKRQHAHLVA